MKVWISLVGSGMMYVSHMRTDINTFHMWQKTQKTQKKHQKQQK